jgi:hypothetical protein
LGCSLFFVSIVSGFAVRSASLFAIGVTCTDSRNTHVDPKNPAFSGAAILSRQQKVSVAGCHHMPHTAEIDRARQQETSYFLATFGL